MFGSHPVREGQLLLGYVDVMDVIFVYNQTLTDTNKVIRLMLQLRSYQLFNLPQLQSHHPRLPIRLHNGRVIAVRGDVNDGLAGNP